MKKNFSEISGRIQAMRQAVMAAVPEVCTDRALWATRAYQAHEQEQVVLKRAYLLQEVLTHMTIYIEDHTLLAGNQAKKDRAAPIFPEYAIDWVVRELDTFALRDGSVFQITEENKQILRDIAPYWHGRTLQDKGYASYPPEARAIYDNGIIRNEGNITSGDAHLAVDYEGVLRHGLHHYKQRAQARLAALDPTDYDQIKSRFFLEAVIIALDAVETFAHRYAALARQQAGTAAPQRRDELLEMARILDKVPMEPADTFHEALQSLWLVHLVLQIESNGHSLSFGRLDQILYPCYCRSRQAGMTDDQAMELLENLWIKSLTINKIRSAGHSKYQAGSPMYQNVTIGGCDAQGKTAVNDLSRLILYSVACVRLTQPNLTVRYTRDMDEDFLQDCIRVIRLGFGMPAFNSDVRIIPALVGQGVSLADARNYAAIGCVEVAVPGKWGYRCTGMSYLNFPKTLMLALNRGVDLMTGKQICKPVGYFPEMETFEEVFDAWDKTARQLIRIGVTLDNCADLVVEQEVPDILCSALVDDCIARGKHLKEGGAHYDMISQLQVGIANLGDSLAAIKKCVFEDKVLTRDQLWNALVTDFAGEEGERIRQILLSAPKYGNDDDYVDELVVRGYDTYLDEIRHYHNTRWGRGPIGGQYYAGTSSVASNVPQGAGTCATPDGRHAGDPLAEGSSPTHGYDKHGPTAVFKSVSKLRADQIVGGVLLNQKVTPQMLESPENCRKLGLLIRTFFDDLQGFHVQYNVVSRETLLDAQVHPENHEDLIVRVAGYSAFFNILARSTQDDIIARTEQTL